MQSHNNRSVQVVKRDEKEAKLTQFILSEIASGRATPSGPWRVLALSADSPVLAALERVVRDLGCAGDLELRVILMTDEKRAMADRFSDVHDVTYRTLSSSRMLDAHEQLVLGESSSWTGDCMRRNPRERDAFETFGADSQELAGWAAKSFDRIWTNAEPLKKLPRRAPANADVLKTVLSGGHSLPKTSVLASSQN